MLLFHNSQKVLPKYCNAAVSMRTAVVLEVGISEFLARNIVVLLPSDPILKVFDILCLFDNILSQ